MIQRIKEISKYKELIFALVIKDLKIKYRRATGGFGWMLVTPLTQMLIFTFIFKFIFKIKVEKYPLFLLSGLFAWSFLSSSLDGAANSILMHANLIKKTYFPREVLPISNIFTNFVIFLSSLGVLSVFSLLSKTSLFPGIFWLPLVIFIQIILIAGISLFLAGLNTIYRETRFIMHIILSVWFYSTPIVYSLDMIKDILPPGLFFIYKLNPFIGIVHAYQNIFLHGNFPNIELLSRSFLLAIISFIIGFIVFRQYESIFADII